MHSTLHELSFFSERKMSFIYEVLLALSKMKKKVLKKVLLLLYLFNRKIMSQEDSITKILTVKREEFRK